MAIVSLYDHGTTPDLTSHDALDGDKYTFGTLWHASVDGSVTSLWIYVGNSNLWGVAGTALLYTGGSWAAAPGTELGRKDFTFSGTPGWQEIVLDTPIAVTAESLYMAAIFIDEIGHYAYTSNFFTTAYTNGVLSAVRGTSDPPDLGNGRYVAGTTPAYPQSRSNNYSNYWIDVSVDTGSEPPVDPDGVTVAVTASDTTPVRNTATTVTATPDGGTNYSYAWTVVLGTGTFGSASAASTTYTPTTLGKHVLKCTVTADEGTVAGYITLDVQGASAAASGTFTATVTDPLGANDTDTAARSITRGGGLRRTQRSLYGSRLSFGDAVTNVVPAITQAVDQPATYVVRFYMMRSCLLTKIRFFKAPQSTGTHRVVVWQLDNQTPLRSQTVQLTADDGGWVEVELDEPLPLTASETAAYLIGYHTPSGHYMRAEWVYGSQEVIEYPFRIGVNGGGWGNVEGTGYSYGGTLVYPSAWMGHSVFIDPVVEWELEDAVYEGGLDYYQRFSAYSDIDHFPIGVWQPLAPSIPGFAALGINTAVTLGGDQPAARAAIVSAGMDVFPGYEPHSGWGTMAQYKADPAFDARVKGYLMADEPDMIPPWKSPEELRNWYSELRKRDPSKMVIFNLGKWPVINRGFGHLPTGASIREANGYWREFAHITDIVSCDFYMEDPANHGGVYGLWCNPRMVKRLHDLSDGSRPIWHYIATTAAPGIEPTGATVYSSVWASLIGGARGIVYFDHQFTSGGTWITDFAMNNNADVRNTVSALNALIQSLAGPLLAPEADITVSIDSSNKTAAIVGGTYGVPIHYTIREHGGYTYLFAQSIRPGTTTGTFTVPAAANKTITVLNESRTLSADGDGVFSDSFSANYQVHLYRWQ